jgi:type VI secretion system VasD/TssJ family lipoprotein
MRTAPLLAAACAAALLAACGGPSYVRVRGVSPLNVNDSNESTPVDVRLYQLKDDGRFTRARVEELFS